jgi:hypothetical protein
VPGRPTPRRARRAVPLATGFLLLGIALAPSAAAVDDPTRPDYTVVSGPSCHPGGVEIRVVDGTVPYSVVLATTRQPDGEDSANLAPGETVLLHTGDVAWGETIDSRLVFTARDGSGDTFADELVPYSFTRPSEKDCAAIAPSLAGSTATVPGTAPTEPDRTAPAGSPQGADFQVGMAAAEGPVAPVHRPPDWALIAAGVSLAVSAGGLLLVAGSRFPGAGRSPGVDRPRRGR